jgi:hypothetical protein
MSITLNTLVYDQDSWPTPNKVKYIGPDHSFAAKDEMYLGRTAPKPTADQRGMARSVVKTVKTVEVDAVTGETGEAIIETTFALPVGITDAVADSLRDNHGDFILSADCGTLTKKHDLTY